MYPCWKHGNSNKSKRAAPATDYPIGCRGCPFAFANELNQSNSLPYRGYGGTETQMQEMTEILDMANKISKWAASIPPLVGKLSTMSDESLSEVDAALLLFHLESAADELESVCRMAAYLSRPVVEIGRLWKNGSGQYETTKGYCFREGSDIEVLVPSQYNSEISFWERTRLQYDGKDYYLAEYPNLPLAGLPVRVRKGDWP